MKEPDCGPRRKVGVSLKSRLSNVMEYQVRDDDVELFNGFELEHVAPLEINSFGEVKDACILFSPL